MYLFLDIETTGLEPEKHCVIELGAILLNDDLTEKARFHTYCRPTLSFDLWSPWCQEQHAKTGLDKKAIVEGSFVWASNFVGWVEEQGALNKDTVVAGASVHFDVSFMSFFPWKLLSHRRLDMSVLRLVDKAAGTGFFPKPAEGVAHTAIADIEFDIAQFKSAVKLFKLLKGATTSIELVHGQVNVLVAG